MDAKTVQAAICDTLNIALLACDLDGAVAYMNPAFEALAGVNLTGDVPLHRRDLFEDVLPADGAPPDDVPSNSTFFSATLITATSDNRRVRIVESPLSDGGAPAGHMLVVEKADERTGAEAALRQSEERYRTLAEAAQDMIFIIDRNDRVAYANGYAARHLDRDPATLVGTPRTELFPPAIADQQGQNLAKVFESGQAAQYEDETVFPEGSVWLDTRLVPLRNGSGEVTSILGVSRDVTDRVRAQEALRESEETAWALLNVSTDVALLLDTDWRILGANEVAADLFDQSVDELVGTDVFSHMPPDVAASRRRKGEEVIATGKPVRFGDHNGDRHLLSTIAPIRDHQGRVSRLAIFSRDITERERATETAREHAASLRTILSIADELIASEDMDALLRKAVALPRKRLGLERCGIFLTDGPKLRGTYGTDMQGRTTDARDVSFEHEFSEDAEELSQDAPKWSVKWGDDERWRKLEPGDVGPRWTACTLIRTASRPVGVLYNDAAITGADPDPDKQDLVAVYCSVLGSIIERKRAEDALMESEERFRSMAEVIPAIFWIASSDGHRMTYVSPVFEKIYQRPVTDVLNRTDAWLSYMHPDDTEHVRSVMRAHEGKPFDSDYRIWLPDGGTRWVSSHAVPVRDADDRIDHYIGFTIDVTARKSAEQALKDSHEVAWALLNTTNEMAALLTPDYTILGANERLAALAHTTADELIGVNALDGKMPQERDSIKTLFDEVVQTGNPGRAEYQHAGRHYMASVNPVRDTTGRPAKLALFVQDVTERKRMDEAQRLAAVGQLAAGVAHEFNNLLASMMLGAELASEDKTISAYDRLTQAVLQATRRGGEICKSLVTFSRPKPPQRRPTQVEMAIEAALAVASRQMQVLGIRVSTEYHTTGQRVYADRGQLEQVFLNLVINACHAMQEGGRLQVSAACRAKPNGDMEVVASVTDTGDGIDPEDLPHVFEPFFTTKGALGEGEIPGTGLGLSVSLGIIAAHNGTIDVASTPGQGSTFSVILPAWTETREDPAGAPETAGTTDDPPSQD